MSAWSALHNNAKVFFALHASFPHASSGYAVRSHAIARCLLAHGVDMHITTRPGFPWLTSKDCTPEMHDTVEGVTYHRIPHAAPELSMGGEYYRSMSRNLLGAALQQSGAYLLHAASNMEVGLPAIQAARDAGVPCVYEYRGMWHYTRQSRFPWFQSSEDFALYHSLELQTGQEANAVFAISEALRDDLISNGIPAQKITVLPNAVEVERFQPLLPDEALIEQWGLAGKKVVGFIGSITAYEGLAYLIDAVLELNAAGENVAFVIVGDGAAVSVLQQHHEARGAHPSIIFTGRVPFEEVNRYYSIMDIMAFPRINAKVCHCVPPLKPLEAMAMGKAVIVSDVAALCEMVIPEQTGLVCQAENTGSLARQLGRLVSDDALYRTIVSNALEWVRAERDWSVVSQRILNVYEDLL